MSDEITGNNGLDTRNDLGDSLIQFCKENVLNAMSTQIKLPVRRLYKWKTPWTIRIIFYGTKGL